MKSTILISILRAYALTNYHDSGSLLGSGRSTKIILSIQFVYSGFVDLANLGAFNIQINEWIFGLSLTWSFNMFHWNMSGIQLRNNHN